MAVCRPAWERVKAGGVRLEEVCVWRTESSGVGGGAGYQVACGAAGAARHEDDAHRERSGERERHGHGEAEQRHDGVLTCEAEEHLNTWSHL